AWGLEIMCRDAKYYSPTVTAVLLPDGHDADAFRNFALDTFNISYGSGFGRYARQYFPIRHSRDLKEGMLIGAPAPTRQAPAAPPPVRRGGGCRARWFLWFQRRGAGGGGRRSEMKRRHRRIRHRKPDERERANRVD